MRLIAKKELRYAGRDLKEGDEFEASARDGKILKAIRKAEEIPTAASDESAPRAKRRAPAGRAGQMQFQEAPSSDAGTYDRRDMRAED